MMRLQVIHKRLMRAPRAVHIVRVDVRRVGCPLNRIRQYLREFVQTSSKLIWHPVFLTHFVPQYALPDLEHRITISHQTAQTIGLKITPQSR